VEGVGPERIWNESVKLADQLWRDYGAYLFSAAAMNSAWNGSGLAATTMAERYGRKNEPQTPQHFFKYPKINFQHGKYGQWYNGPRMVDEFLSEIELHIRSHPLSALLPVNAFGDVSERVGRNHVRG
jgi:hypothetical protein